MTEKIILKDELAEIDSFKAAEAAGLIPRENEHAHGALARRMFGLGFRFALGYLRFKWPRESDQ